MKRFSYFLLLAAYATIFSACTTVSVNIPLNRMETPEVSGSKDKFGFGLGGDSVATFQFTSDASSRPLSITAPPTLDPTFELFGRLDYSLSDFFAIYYRSNLESFAPQFIGAKLQILGQPSSVAKSGNFSLAVTAAAVFGYVYSDGNQKGSFGPGGFPWNSDINTTGQDFAAIVGYRLSELFLLYGGAFMSNFYTGGSIHQGLSSDGTSPAAQTTFNVNTAVQGENIDLSFRIPFLVRAVAYNFEYSWCTVKWTGNNSQNLSTVGILGQVTF